MISQKDIHKAAGTIAEVTITSPINYCKRLSEQYRAEIYLKREDLQEVRSFKIRGAYNLIKNLTPEERQKGVVCVSAGNHAQGVAYSCSALKIKGTIFMPLTTPNQKVQKVKKFGGSYAKVKLVGNNFDESSKESKEYCRKNQAVFVHPFDDERTIAGQGTIGKEILDQTERNPDYVLMSVGGGGLASGVATYLKEEDRNIKIVGVESQNQASMYTSLKNGKVSTITQIDTFLDGTAVKTPGETTFKHCRKYLDKVELVKDGQVCVEMINLYQNEGIITEPSGALSLAALENMREEIKGKMVVCIVSGGNNDLLRYPEIVEKSLIYQGLKHYFIIEFAQKPGQLKRLVDKVLGPKDDIVRFEYIKKNDKEKGPALVGIELNSQDDYEPLIQRLKENEISYQVIDPDDPLYGLIV
jgi:threonine dehydratase